MWIATSVPDMSVCSATASASGNSYTMSFNTHESTVYFSVSATTTQWVAIGFSQNQIMVITCCYFHSPPVPRPILRISNPRSVILGASERASFPLTTQLNRKFMCACDCVCVHVCVQLMLSLLGTQCCVLHSSTSALYRPTLTLSLEPEAEMICSSMIGEVSDWTEGYIAPPQNLFWIYHLTILTHSLTH